MCYADLSSSIICVAKENLQTYNFFIEKSAKKTITIYIIYK